jgi:hypothetical protein
MRYGPDVHQVMGQFEVNRVAEAGLEKSQRPLVSRSFTEARESIVSSSLDQRFDSFRKFAAEPLLAILVPAGGVMYSSPANS